MIVDSRELPEDFLFHADVAIVGAGPAGITLAHELMGSGLTVLLLEAGGAKPDDRRLDLFHGEVSDLARHPPITLYRVRAFGGGSTLWGGRCVKFDPIDFEARPHIPHSGWPVTYDEIEPWYRVANAYCEAGPCDYDSRTALPGAPPVVPGLDEARVSCASIERFSPPTDFARRYRPALARSNNVIVVLNATCTGIEPVASRQAVRHLAFASAPGRRFQVAARHAVLAAGALETARLLLAAKLGGDAVGRFYMCHLEGKAARAVFTPDTKVVFEYERDRAGIYLRRRFALPPEIQRQQGLTNVILRFEPPVIADPVHGDAVLSAMWVSRTFLKREYARKLDSFGYRGAQRGSNVGLALRHLRNVAVGAPGLARFSADWLTRHVLASRKLPYVAVRGRNGAFTLDYNAEQIPNPDSRVSLGNDTDAFGMPRLKVDWRVTALDVDSVVAAHALLARELEASGRGMLEIDEEVIRQGYNATGGHHIGTARMAADASAGVVDRDGRVFGMDNLYVAGAATFPTSSHANPTLTIVALAARLAAHLKVQARRPSPADALAEAAE
ncbi:MAG TPA: GMC family oxidoreductase [Candidatus Omnitrophota bacterium]|nr:GMC family oxidoreductase [Candidatus Omnitrophota bacterium]